MIEVDWYESHTLNRIVGKQFIVVDDFLVRVCGECGQNHIKIPLKAIQRIHEV